MQQRLTRPPATTPGLYAQDGQGYRATVHAHYFVGGNDWLVTEYDPDQDLAFGWTCLNGDRQNAELGYTSVAELESIDVPARVVSYTGLCLACGEDYVPGWEEDLVHLVRQDGQECGGTGVVTGHYGTPPVRVEYEEGWVPVPLQEAIGLLDRRQGLVRG